MNSFANSLFSLLFGWARSLIQQLWESASSGKYGGVLTWLGDHWLWLALFLCVAGTAVDFLVWFIRWRPYLAWRTSLRRFFSFFQRIGREDARRFKQGYQGGVALDIAQGEAAPGDVWPEEAWQEPSARPMEEPVQEAVPASFPPQQEAEAAPQRRFTPPAYEAPPMVWNGRETPDFAPASFPSRRRRSDRYERRRAEWRERLIRGDEEEESLLDSLPPAADRQQAFYEPVYPRQSSAQESPYASWRRPGGSDTDGST